MSGSQDRAVDATSITIITAVYNGGTSLLDTIESVRKVKGPGVRYIVVDGKSKDDTIEIIKRAADVIDQWISEPDKGVYDAFNKGWKLAAADSFVLYLGAGDRIISLPSLSNLAVADVIYGTVKIGDSRTFRSSVGFRLRLGNLLHHQALLVRKSLFPEGPFDLRFRRYADFDVNQRLLKRKVGFLFDEHFVAFALPGGITDQFNAHESAQVVLKNFGVFYYLLAWVYYAFQAIRGQVK